MEKFERKNESIGDITINIEGKSLVLKKVESEEGVSYRISEGAIIKSDGVYGQDELVMDYEGATPLDTDSDLFQCGYGSQKMKKDGVLIDLNEGIVTGVNEEDVRVVLDGINFKYVDPGDV